MDDKDLEKLIKSAAEQVAETIRPQWDGVSDRRGQSELHPEAVERLARIETTVIASDKTLTKVVDDHEHRLRKVETKTTIFTVTAGTGLVGGIGTWLSSHFKFFTG